MSFKVIPVTPFVQNCTIFYCPLTKECGIIDPGGDVELIYDYIEKNELKPTKIILTHGHLDHVGGTAEIVKHYQIPVIGPHIEDKFWLNILNEQAMMFGLERVEDINPNQWLNEGDQVKIGTLEFDIFHCPGHTPGHIVLIDQKNKIAQVGDVIFHGSIGRTDFPRGNHEDLIQSIKKKLLPLGDDIEFIPGHGPNSTFGQEKRYNPYIQ